MNVSVVIPAYNRADTISAAVASVMAQGLPETPEIIIVDDASTDETVEAVENIPADFRVTLLTQTRNAGPAAARNRGISKSSGHWIAFLDADDEWLEGKLTAQLRLAQENPDISLWCTGVESVDGDDGGMAELTLEDFVTENPVATSTVMIRKEALTEIGGFDERFSGAEDYDLWMRILADEKWRAAKINKPLVKYRSELGSLSMDDRKFLPDALQVLNKSFAPGGALEGFVDKKDMALANQYWNASWMAFNRGSRRDAVALWRKGYRIGRELDRPWLKLLLRYLIGRVKHEEGC